MDEFQQVLEGGVGAAAFYLLFISVNIIKSLVSGKPKGTRELCSEHQVVCLHLETIREDVSEIKGSVNRIVRDVAEMQGRLEV